MSGGELAPFVAAAIRDSVVTKLHEELQNLRDQYQLVEITGAKGKPVYVRKLFREGQYSSPLEWSIELTGGNSSKFESDSDDGDMTMAEGGGGGGGAGGTTSTTLQTQQQQQQSTQQLLLLSLRDLSSLEVRVGGMTRAVWHCDVQEGFVEESCYCATTGYATNIGFCLGMVSGIYISLDIQMPNETYQYMTLKDAFGGPVVANEGLSNFIQHTLADDAKIRLRRITFFVDKFDGAMKAWNIPPYKCPLSPFQTQQTQQP